MTEAGMSLGAGCQLISAAEKRAYHRLKLPSLENKDMGNLVGAFE